SPANFKDSTAFSARCAPHLRRCGGGRRPRRCAHGAPLFVWIPAYVGTTTYLSPAKFKESAAFSWRCATHLRRSGGGRSPGLCAHGAPFFVWIPAYVGTTTYLSPATFEAPGFFASLRVNHCVRDSSPTIVPCCSRRIADSAPEHDRSVADGTSGDSTH